MPIILTEKDRLRFNSKLRRDEATGCLLYCGATNNRGYGMFWVTSCHEKIPAHRVAYVLAGGALTDGHSFVMHSCDRPRCCEPSHLTVGTCADNLADMAAKGRGRRSKLGLPRGVYQVPGCDRYYGRFWKDGRWHWVRGGHETAGEAAEAVGRARDLYDLLHA